MQFRIDQSGYKNELNNASELVERLTSLGKMSQDTLEINMYFESAQTIAVLVQHLLNEESTAKMYKSKWEHEIGATE
jgi:hypothetical protein